MVGAHAALVAKVKIHFIPRKLRAQPSVVGKQGIQRFGSGATRQSHGERAFLGHSSGGSLNEFLGNTFGDSVEVSQNPYVALHNFSKRCTALFNLPGGTRARRRAVVGAALYRV